MGRDNVYLSIDPPIVMGTGGLVGESGHKSILAAFDVGYRAFDTAFSYGNEKVVGRALSTRREQVFIITKLPGRAHGRDATKQSIHDQLRSLEADYIDLYLIHWPLPRLNKYLESWEELIQARDKGCIRSIGVSNFTESMIQRLSRETGVVPDVAQFECHPWWPQDELVEFLRSTDIAPMAWSPLRKAQGGIFQSPAVLAAARQTGLSPAETILAWHAARRVIPVVKSRSPEHMAQNLAAVRTEHDRQLLIDAIAAETCRLRRGGDPELHEEY